MSGTFTDDMRSGGDATPDWGMALRFAVVLGLVVTGVVVLPLREDIGKNSISVRQVVAASSGALKAGKLSSKETAVTAIAPPAAARASLLTSRFERTSASSLQYAPQIICELLDPAAAMVWSPSELFPGEWECLSAPDRQTGALSDAPHATMFAMARGAKADRLGYFRIKLTVAADADQGAALAMLERRVDGVLQVMGTKLPDVVRSSLRAGTDGRAKVDGTTYSFMSEKMSTGRYNMIVQFPDRSDGKFEALGRGQ